MPLVIKFQGDSALSFSFSWQQQLDFLPFTTVQSIFEEGVAAISNPMESTINAQKRSISFLTCIAVSF